MPSSRSLCVGDVFTRNSTKSYDQREGWTQRVIKLWGVYRGYRWGASGASYLSVTPDLRYDISGVLEMPRGNDTLGGYVWGCKSYVPRSTSLNATRLCFLFLKKKREKSVTDGSVSILSETTKKMDGIMYPPCSVFYRMHYIARYSWKHSGEELGTTNCVIV